jgi:hypothetical protein
MVESDLFIRETKPRTENPSARIIRLRLVDNARNWFRIFIDRKCWEIGLREALVRNFSRLVDETPCAERGVVSQRFEVDRPGSGARLKTRSAECVRRTGQSVWMRAADICA